MGSSSLIITLPKDWARRIGLKPGDNVYVVERENELRLIPFVSEEEEGIPVVIKITSPSIFYVEKMLRCAFRLGLKKIILMFDKPADEKVIQEAEKLIQENNNYIITEKSGYVIKLKSILDPYRFDTGLLMRELMSMTSRNIEYLANFVEGKIDNIEQVLAETKNNLKEMVSIRDRVINILIQKIDSVKGDLKEERKRVLSLNIFSMLWALLKTLNDQIVELMEKHREVKMDSDEFRNEVYTILRGIDNALWETMGALSNESYKRATAARNILYELERNLRNIEEKMVQQGLTPVTKFLLITSHIHYQLHHCLDMIECLINIDKLELS